MEKNLPLLKETMQVILANPELHNNSTWISPCDSTMCYAGHAAMLAGAEFDFERYEANGQEWLVDETGKARIWCSSGSSISISSYAQEKLGLSDTEANYLFYANRTVDELVEAVDKFQEGYSLVQDDSWEEYWVRD